MSEQQQDQEPPEELAHDDIALAAMAGLLAQPGMDPNIAAVQAWNSVAAFHNAKIQFYEMQRKMWEAQQQHNQGT